MPVIKLSRMTITAARPAPRQPLDTSSNVELRLGIKPDPARQIVLYKLPRAPYATPTLANRATGESEAGTRPTPTYALGTGRDKYGWIWTPEVRADPTLYWYGTPSALQAIESALTLATYGRVAASPSSALATVDAPTAGPGPRLLRTCRR